MVIARCQPSPVPCSATICPTGGTPIESKKRTSICEPRLASMARASVVFPEPDAPVRTTSVTGGPSQIQHEPLRVLQAFLDSHQERHGLAAIDDAVVVAEREVHH